MYRRYLALPVTGHLLVMEPLDHRTVRGWLTDGAVSQRLRPVPPSVNTSGPFFFFCLLSPAAASRGVRIKVFGNKVMIVFHFEVRERFRSTSTSYARRNGNNFAYEN